LSTSGHRDDHDADPDCRNLRKPSRRDVRRLSGIVMPENVPMLKLLERHARGLVRRVTSEHVAFEYPLPAAA